MKASPLEQQGAQSIPERLRHCMQMKNRSFKIGASIVSLVAAGEETRQEAPLRSERSPLPAPRFFLCTPSSGMRHACRWERVSRSAR